jgi:DNA-binding response OmpR family regulator
MRIMVVEDDPRLARGIVGSLKAEGFAVDHFAEGEDAIDQAGCEPYSTIILDLGLPDMDGLEVLRRMRRHGVRTPVLILTARDTLNDRVSGLDQGADDYMSKPFEPTEFQARVRALVRRGQNAPDPLLQVGGLVLDRSNRVATLNGRPLALRRRETAVLEALMSRAGKLVSRSRLSADVFDYDAEVSPNALEVHVGRLRRKLQPDGPEINTVRGLGYILEVK